MTGGAVRELLGDPRFFETAGPFGLDALIAVTGGTLERGELAGGRSLTGVAALETATPDQLSVLHNPRYVAQAGATSAGVVIAGAALAGRVAASSAVLVVDDPHVAWAHACQLFHPLVQPRAGIHPSAVVDPSAEIGPGCEIGPCAVIGGRARIGANCLIGPNAVIGSGVVMGDACRVGAGASISHAVLGTRVYVYPGARIGQEGFGFAIAADGFVTVPQLGRVILEDNVEVGANTCVDRGASHDTVIGAGSRIDNLIQIGHNVQLGRGCVMAAQSGISGSSTVGDFVQIGAQVGLAGHLRIGTKSRIGAQAGVMSDVAAGSELVGSPALPIREFFRNVAVLRRLARRGPVAGGTDGQKAAG